MWGGWAGPERKAGTRQRSEVMLIRSTRTVGCSVRARTGEGVLAPEATDALLKGAHGP